MSGNGESKRANSPSESFVLSFKRLSRDCERGAFHCGSQPIDEWFRNQAQTHVEALTHNVVTAHLTADLPRGGRPDPAGFFALRSMLIPKHLLTQKAAPKSRAGEPQFPSVELSYVAVQEDLQKGGIGTKLMGLVLDEFYEAAIRTGIQFLTLTAVNVDVVPFYENLGFTVYAEGVMPKMVLPAKSVLQTVRAARASGVTFVVE